MDTFFKNKKQEEEEERVKDPLYATAFFKLPIEHLDTKDVFDLSPVVVSDLELVLGENPVYESLFCRDGFSRQVYPMYQHKITTNTLFLEESQQVISNMGDFKMKFLTDISCAQLQSQWTDVKHDTKFMDTYGYIDWSILEHCNRSSAVLQSITLANMLSPLMSFIVPLLFLIFPFVILKLQGVPVTMTDYMKVLKEIAKHHFIGKALTSSETFSFHNILYLFATFVLYGLQMYQNTNQCLRFYKNTQKINKDLMDWKQFVSQSKNKMDTFLTKNESLQTYSSFCATMRDHKSTLEELEIMLEPIHEFQSSISKSTEIGYMLKCYYELHTSDKYEMTILYSMGLDGYLGLMKSVSQRLAMGSIHKATFCTGPQMIIEDDSGNVLPECSITAQYYPSHKKDEAVINNVVLDIFGVITGPNASGKTTFLKTTAINIILSQQLGIGFFESCKLRPYTQIHSYLNIPDTSGRDSLFQAESRRCKEILDNIDHETGHHFCIFDELYSGTNPKEATKAAYAFLEYMRKYKHVDIFLTTHYVSICDKWDMTSTDKRQIQNYKMNVNEDNHVPTYKLTKGISYIEGAIHILKEMQYPKEMITMISMEED